MQIDFDPSVISYGDLLEVFWNAHNPIYGEAYGQYRSMILYQNEEQRRQAEDSMARKERLLGAHFTDHHSTVEKFYPGGVPTTRNSISRQTRCS